MPTEVANAGEHRTYKIFALDFPICLWAPSQADEQNIHDQEADLPGLLQMWPVF
jgi:hypothetical protein